jgi:hypothetical protein
MVDYQTQDQEQQTLVAVVVETTTPLMPQVVTVDLEL